MSVYKSIYIYFFVWLYRAGSGCLKKLQWIQMAFKSPAPFSKSLGNSIEENYFISSLGAYVTVILIIFNILFWRTHSSISTPPQMCFPIVVNSSIIIIISSYTVK